MSLKSTGEKMEWKRMECLKKNSFLRSVQMPNSLISFVQIIMNALHYFTSQAIQKVCQILKILGPMTAKFLCFQKHDCNKSMSISILNQNLINKFNKL